MNKLTSKVPANTDDYGTSPRLHATKNGIDEVVLVDGEGGGSGQMLGEAEVKAISFNSQVINESITIGDVSLPNINAYSVGDITIGNGFDLTVENGSIYKIL